MNATLAATLTVSVVTVLGALYVLATACSAVAPVAKALGAH